MKHYKGIFCDLDGTLINTITGNIFPKGIWDMKFNMDLLNALKDAKPDEIYIVTNQGGIESGYVLMNDFLHKLEYIRLCIKEYTGVFVITRFCSSNSKDDERRKPNTGMFRECINKTYSKEDCCMIGDMDSDKFAAINFGIDYYDVDDFIREAKEVATDK